WIVLVLQSPIAIMVGPLKNTCSINLVVLKKLASRSCLLPDDVLIEILSYLPAKTFFKFLSVCKTFRQLSSNSHFLLSQSYHSKAISGFFVQRYSTFRSLLLIDPYAGMPRSSLDCLRNRNTRILGSVGGLVFVWHRNDGSFNATTSSLFVYNPARRTRCHLPSPPSKCLRGGIAVRFMTDINRLTKDYKLVYLSPTGQSSLYHCQVYDSAARAWTMNKQLNCGWRALDLQHPVVNGETVFWVSTLRTQVVIDPYVFAFNMRTECTETIELPQEATVRDADTIGIAEWERRTICLIHYGSLSQVFALWLLRETRNGVPRWMKAHEISLGQMGLRKPCYVSSVMLSEVETIMLLVFTVYDEVYSYSIQDGDLKKLGSVGIDDPTLIPYVNLLRPCGEQEELLEAI
ncbi:unnamed protein product, partial [Musa acuminata var. zebrina]